MTNVVAYCRISLDDSGQALGVKRQEADCRKLADLRGWTVSQVLTDNDVSAFKRNVIRPGFEKLLELLASGKVDGVVVYDLDRFARQPRDLERAVDLFEGGGLLFATVSGDIDLSSADGLVMARVLVAFANKSSRDTGRRVARKHLERAQAGIPVGGTRPFGWQDDKLTINEPEAQEIRTAVEKLLTGASLHSVVRDWNERGLLTSKGNEWVTASMRQMLKSPRLVGHRVHRGEVLRDEHGEPVRGTWTPILDERTWQALVGRFEASRGHGERPGKRVYLLSGIARCALCGHHLRGNADTAKNTYYLACPAPTAGGCGKVGVSGPKADALVTEAILERWTGFSIQRTQSTFPRGQELTEASERVSELMAAYGSGTLSANAVFPVVRQLESEISSLRAEQRAWEASSHEFLEYAPAKRWHAGDVHQRRDLLSQMLHAVVVRPAAARGGRFDPARVTIVWKGYDHCNRGCSVNSDIALGHVRQPSS